VLSIINIPFKKTSVIAVIIILCVSTIILHNSFFRIREKDIGETIVKNLSSVKGANYSIQDIKIRKQLNFDIRKVVVYSFPSENDYEIVGFADFFKGLNNKYAVGNIYNEKDFIYNFVKRGLKDQYLIIAGKNHHATICSIEVTKKDGSRYTEDLSKEKYFIFKADVSSLDHLHILDKEGKDLPKETFDIYVEEKIKD